MCQYQSECPTTRHRPGTKCPLRVSIENHNRKVDAENRGAMWGFIGLAVIAAGMFAYFWFYVRDGSTGIGIPALDDLLIRNPAMVMSFAFLRA